jgi:hypothetical protein
LLSWVHVLEWRAAVTPDAAALSDDRNATGKVLRSALREPFWAGRDRRVS